MVYKTSRPISDAERAKLEPEIKDFRLNSAETLLSVLVLGTLGVGLVALVGALIVNRASLPSPALIFALSVILAVIGLFLLYKAATRVVSLLRPLGPLRPERDLRGAFVHEVSIDVDQAWWSDLIVDRAWVLIRDQSGSIVSLSGDALSDLIEDPDSDDPLLQVARHTRVVVFEDDIVAVLLDGDAVTAARIADNDVYGLERPWMSDAIRVLDDTDLDRTLREKVTSAQP